MATTSTKKVPAVVGAKAAKPVAKVATIPAPGGKVPIKGEGSSNKLPKHAMHARGRNRGMGKKGC